jgi:putative restriction endonuclease
MATPNMEAIITKLTAQHESALRWFETHTGQTLAWSEIAANAETGVRLATLAKGIYKPAYTDYALSVRQTIDGPYADKEVDRREDGSWVYPYYQENADPAQRDRAATNRGLVKCLSDGVPIGVLLQTKPKPGVEYEVLGLAMVTEWEDGYFILEGLSRQDDLSPHRANGDAAYDRAKSRVIGEVAADFSLESMLDDRKRQIAEVVRRQGQSKFRRMLIEAYDGKCVITGCDALEVLEAAHIVPYLGGHTNHPQNGLLLRADLHSLFDMGLLSIDPISLTVILSARLRRSHSP